MHRCVCARMPECVCPQDRTHTRVGVVYVSVHALYASVRERACPDPTRDEWAQAAHNSCKSRQLPIDSGSALMFVSDSSLHTPSSKWGHARACTCTHAHVRAHIFADAITHLHAQTHVQTHEKLKDVRVPHQCVYAHGHCFVRACLCRDLRLPVHASVHVRASEHEWL